ncbi:non-homologous end-joining DNA ligase [Mycolicibacterium phocaicum]|uniref:DNA ligase (ATP) n=1 Tax=Mycolicibacterium phocaicum TaxID=319706 RepID=A0A7I7ZRH4_9MYCO|nr:non-homologous end-joining DNA ligase [Mycolicibacterium phocaicum]TLH73738.1 ATP-dependent DNA ligase [Mycolicibacterium phocaicum]UCZ61328.1 non-homologous end-joining DNA ligase [Mycolicibacterium phocaicum]BBZ55843.1 multifunctional non-homologous end joining protein LigD [Mycolicibacterium phocaicum]
MEQFGRVRLTNPDKVLYPATGTTKADVFDYYLAVADAMLPHIAGRPVTRKRWPNGVAQQPFFEKQLASSAPEWLARGAITHRSGTTVYPVIDTPEGLAWIAQQASLEVHVPQWRFVDATVGPATRIVFDLDPGEGVVMAQLCEVAQAVRELVAGMDLEAYPVTSGSKGLHLYVPLTSPVSSRGASAVAKRVAQQLESSMGGLVTATMTRSLRAGKVFLDWSQNSAAKTTVAPYSLRGRDEPTVAAPRTWEELDDPELRQLRFDEVLARLARDGDLLAGMDVDAPVADRLTTYRSMRDPGRTPEPVPAAQPASGQNNRFVIQEHHARRLHYDFRLERDGVLVSWAVPKNLPDTSTVNHLAVHTEDHPLEYATFEGDIPKGEYGGGHVAIWDSGTYDTEKFRDSGENGEVIVNLHGNRVSGRYVLIQTEGKNWLVRRMKEQRLQPMLATHGSVDRLSADHWAFEGKWDGYRLLVDADHGRIRLTARSGRDVTGEYPQLQSLAADLADHHVILDGEVVALQDGVPSFQAMQNRGSGSHIEFWCFDILSLDGRDLTRAKYRDRRKLLETLASGGALTVPPLLPADDPLKFADERGFEGVVAKKWDSGYRPGRSEAWVKDKFWRTQEVVIGGWRAGEGGRTSGIGALLIGVPEGDGLQFVGRVGTGFTDKMLADLKAMLKPLETSESPFTAPLSTLDGRGVTFVRPELVGEVRYSERTTDNRLRQPSWRGLRPDKTPAEVTWE